MEIMGKRIGTPSRLAPRALSPSGSSANGQFTIVWLRVAVLASSVALMLPGMWSHSVTVVEFAQLPAGLAAWQRHSLGIYRVCGPLSKLLYALPAHLAGVQFDYPASFDSDVQRRKEWELGRIFQQQNRERYHDIYRWSRLLPILATVLGGCLICEWSTRLFGKWPGIFSLCVWCWMPPILAHGSLVTSDMLSAVTLLVAARSFWAFLLKPTLRLAMLAGLTLGLATVTKFTLLIIYPYWLLLSIARAILHRGSAMDGPGETSPAPTRMILLGSVLFIISIVALDALYLFQDVGFRLTQWQPRLSSLGGDLQHLREGPVMTWLLRGPLPIPLEFLRGLDFQLADTERQQSAYLLGSTRPGGWWYWYAVAFLIKVPLPVLVLYGLSLARLRSALRDRDSIFWATLCLIPPAAGVALVISGTTGTGTNAAFRYLIPSLGLLCVWVGQLANSGSKAIRLTSIVLLGWLTVDATVGTTDHLGWQNELGWAWNHRSGRPALIGDSLDWGQDLARLGQWISRHSDEGSTLICAYGLGEGEPYGLRSPTCRPASNHWEGSTYLAVSEEVLLGDGISHYITIAGEQSFLKYDQRQILLQTSPFDRVGRTIRIYRLSDLVHDKAFPGL
jgi:hypothetical protein